MNKYKESYESYYGEGSYCNITFKRKKFKGLMYGNDECFDGDEFYQVFLPDNDDAIYYFYYDIPVSCTDYGEINYDKPCRIERQYDEESDYDFWNAD